MRERLEIIANGLYEAFGAKLYGEKRFRDRQYKGIRSSVRKMETAAKDIRFLCEKYLEGGMFDAGALNKINEHLRNYEKAGLRATSRISRLEMSFGLDEYEREWLQKSMKYTHNIVGNAVLRIFDPREPGK